MNKYCAVEINKLVDGFITYGIDKRIIIYKYENKVYFDALLFDEYNPWEPIYNMFGFSNQISLDEYFENINIFVGDMVEVQEYVNRQTLFGGKYVIFEYDIIVLFRNLVEKSKELNIYNKCDSYKMIIFCLWIYFNYYGEVYKSKFFVEKEVKNLPWSSFEFNYMNLYINFLLIDFNRYSSSENIYDYGNFYIKDIKLYNDTVEQLRQLLNNYGFFNTKLIVKNVINPMYYADTFIDNIGNLINLKDMYLDKPLINFNENNNVYNSYFGDNEIVFLSTEQISNDIYIKSITK